MGLLKNLRDTLNVTKRRSSAIKVCPGCGNPKIRLSSREDVYPTKMYGITPMQYVCEECGYKGPVVMEVEEESSCKTE